MYHEWVYDGGQNIQTIKIHYDDGGSPATADLHTVLWDDTPARITKVTNAINSDVISYSYNGSGRLTKVEGNCTSCSGANVGRSYTYVDDNGTYRVEEVKDSTGTRMHKFVYDVEGRVITRYRHNDQVYATWDFDGMGTGIIVATDYVGVEGWTYMDANGYTTKSKTRSGANDYRIFEKYVDANGNITRQQWASSINGATTKWQRQDFEVDSNNRGTLEIQYDYDGANPITVKQFSYDDNGNLTLAVDAVGLTKERLYSAENRVTKLTLKNGGVDLSTKSRIYDANGQVITFVDVGNITHATDYDANGYVLTRTQDVGGLAITQIYFPDSAGRVTKRTDARSQDWLTYYNNGGTITKTQDPAGKIEAYIYDLDGQLLTLQTFENGGSITLTQSYDYDVLGRQITSKDAAGNATIYLYDNMDRVTHIENPDGTKHGTVYGVLGVANDLAYDGSGWITKASYEYDHMGRTTKQTDANGIVVSQTSAYDGYGQLTRQTDNLGNYTVSKYDAMNRLTQQSTYDSGDTARSENRTAYDERGRTTSSRSLASPGGSTSNDDVLVEMDYDEQGQILTRTTYLSGASTTAKQVFAYDSAGRVITQTQDDGPTVAFLYDDSDLTKTITDPADLALATSLDYDELGRTTRTTNPDSTYAVTIYDDLGRVTKSIRYDSGNTAFAAAEPLYHDGLGVITKSYQYADPTQASFNATNDPTTESVYTAAGRLTKTIDPNTNTTTYDYDSLGRRITITEPGDNKNILVYDDASGILTSIRIDENGASDVTFTTAYEYDALNRLTKTIDQGPDADITVTEDNLIAITWYDTVGQVTQTQNPESIQTTRAYDDLGRLTRQTEDSSGIARYTDYLYDRASRLTRQTGYTSDATGAQNTDYLYNKVGVLTKANYPDSSTMSFAFDSINRVTRRTDPRSINLDSAYDSMGRLLTKQESTNIYWTYAYGPDGQPTSAKKGTSAGGEEISKSAYSYDGLRRLTRHAQDIRSVAAKNTDFLYDKAGNLTAEYYPSGSLTISHTVTGLNQTNIISRNGTQLADYDYVGSRVDDLMYETGANDVQADRLYDGVGRMTRLTWAQTANTLPDFSYTFDKAGNITRKTHEHRASNPVEDYIMDGLYRLTNARYDSRTLTHGITYDDLGNQLTFNENANQTTGYFNEVNELTKVNTTQQYYDLAGNVTKDTLGGNGPYSYYYDVDNKLTKVSNSGGDVATYEYDAQGRRIEFIDSVNTVTKLYYHEGDRDRVIEEYNGAGTPARQRYLVWGNYIDELLMYYEDGDTADYFVTYNHRFSPAALLGSTGTVQETYEYDAFGKPVIYTDDGGDGDWWDGDETSATVSAKNLSYLFTGREYDHLDNGDFTIMYYRARYYDTVTRRFLQRDPSGYVDGMDLYAGYFAQRMHLDPMGLEDECHHESWDLIPSLGSLYNEIKGELPWKDKKLKDLLPEPPIWPWSSLIKYLKSITPDWTIGQAISALLAVADAGLSKSQLTYRDVVCKREEDGTMYFKDDGVPTVTLTPSSLFVLGVGASVTPKPSDSFNQNNDKTKKFWLDLEIAIKVDPSIFGFKGQISVTVTQEMGTQTITAGEGQKD